MTAICPFQAFGEDGYGQRGRWPRGPRLKHRQTPRREGGVVREAVMSTIDIHEPEVKEAKPATRPPAAVLPRTELVLGPQIPQRPIFSDSLLEFGVQRKRKAFATTTSIIVNCVAIGILVVVPLLFTEDLPKAQLLTFLVAPPPPPPPTAGRGTGAAGGEADRDRPALLR